MAEWRTAAVQQLCVGSADELALSKRNLPNCSAARERDTFRISANSSKPLSCLELPSFSRCRLPPGCRRLSGYLSGLARTSFSLFIATLFVFPGTVFFPSATAHLTLIRGVSGRGAMKTKLASCASCHCAVCPSAGCERGKRLPGSVRFTSL